MAVSKVKGERAMRFIADHPLYASTCGISYDQAVRVAKALLGTNWEKQLDAIEAFEKLSLEEQEAYLKKVEAARV